MNHTPTKPREQWQILGVLCAAAFLILNNFGSVNVALPALQEEFASSLAEIGCVGTRGLSDRGID